MKKEFLILGAVLLFLVVMPGVMAEVNVDVEKPFSNQVVIKEINEPIKIDVVLTNNGGSGEFEFYSYIPTEMSPNTIQLDEGERKNVTLEFHGLQDVIDEGNLAFNFFIKRKSTRESQKEQLVVRVKKLKNAIEINTESVTPTDDKININIKNKVNYEFENLDVKMSSPFFDIERSFSLQDYEEKNFNPELDKKGFGNLLAGFYTLDTEINFKNKSAEYETPIQFVEKEIIKTTRENKGFFIDREIVKKVNEGNNQAKISITTQENIISRLFTTFNEYPDSVDREGGKVFFNWDRELKPGESLEIETKTNWFYPLIIILLVVGIVYFVKKFTTKDVELRKKIHFVKTKGGEFGLKISIIVNSNKYVENVKIRDRLPALAKIHERFGGERPSNIDQKRRKIEWEFNKLEVGERRMVSYVIYSKIGVLGRFALPPATAFYQKEGETHESQSNRAYFVAEQARKESSE